MNNNINQNNKLKIILIKIVAGLLHGLVYLKDKSPISLKFVLKPLSRAGKIIVIIIILPIYKLYLTIKKSANKFYAPHLSRHKIIHPLSRRYLTHIILVIMAIFTLAENLNAYETRQENFGQTSVIATIINKQDLGIIEQEGPILASKKITRYMSQTSVEQTDHISAGDEDLLPSITTGSSAIINQILSPTEEGLRNRDEIVYYTVQQGDTISEIAEKFGISTNTILWENNLSAYHLIQPGEKLTILPDTGIRHKVATGETLSKIAKKYNVEADKIIEINKLASADDIKIGEQLLIPGGKKINTTPVYSIRQTWTAPTTAIVSTGKMVWPGSCRRITQYFGWQHSGLDIACPYGQPIKAADSGRVVKAQGGYNGGYGIMIMIDHGNGIQTLYGHLSSLYVGVGETVSKGQTIGAEGSTGRSTGPHLHFEVRVGDVRKNPLYYIQ